MRYSVLFVVTLILISGFIAYFGDILGRRMGKRRLTLFNLRPRYTAIVVTTITGMIISALAVAALVAVNSQFRKVLAEGEHILTQNKRLSSANVKLARSNRLLIERRGELVQLVAIRQKELEAARKQFREAAKARDAARKAVTALEKEIADRKRDIELLRARKLAAEYDLERKTDDLNKLQAELGWAQKQLHDRQASLESVAQSLALATTNLTSTNAKLRDIQKKLTLVESQLSLRTAELKTKEAELTRAERKIMEVEALKSKFEQRSIKLSSGDLVVRQGDEVARGTISPNQTLFGIKADLISLLESASETIKGRGAGIGTNGRAVRVVMRAPDNSIDQETSETQCIQLAAETISTCPVDALVQVKCAINTVAGEQAWVELVLYYNNLVFKKGERIAEARLDGRLSEGRVLFSLVSFLQTEVAEAAIRRGIVPVTNYDPRTNPNVNPRRQLEGLLAVVDQIRAKRSKVDVQVYASQDVHAIGPLNMDNMRFAVTKAE